MSKFRHGLSLPEGDLVSPPEGDLQAYEVFIQVERGKPHAYAGSVDAPDDEIAMLFAKEHYGRDQECVQLWVVPRRAVLATDNTRDLVFRLSDQSYRFAKGYPVGEKWRKFREKKAYDEYKREDLKEHF